MADFAATFATRLKKMNDEFEEFKKLLEIKQNGTSRSSSREAKEKVLLSSSPVLDSDLASDPHLDLDPVMELESDSENQGVQASKSSTDLLKPFDGCDAAITDKSLVVQTEGRVIGRPVEVIAVANTTAEVALRLVRPKKRNEDADLKKIEMKFNRDAKMKKFEVGNVIVLFEVEKSNRYSLVQLDYEEFTVVATIDEFDRGFPKLDFNGDEGSTIKIGVFLAVVFDPGGNKKKRLIILQILEVKDLLRGTVCNEMKERIR